MNKRFTDYQDELISALQDPREAIGYLNAALQDEDPRIFLVALKNVLDAQDKDLAEFARETQLNRENLYRMLSSHGNPKLTSIVSVLNGLGLHLAIQEGKRK